tara:strand:- start:61 stop:1467 length:1407 start_codon:yes stop_codon:yes gene_type:complete
MALINTSQQNYYTGNNSQEQNYQFVPLVDIINQFMIAYVGEDKIISKIKRSDVSFFAQRAMQELSFDTFKSQKAIELNVPNNLQIKIPQDFVSWTKMSTVDASGIKHRLYPTLCKTGNPFKPQQDENGDFVFTKNGSLIKSGELINNSTQQGGIPFSNNSSLFLNKDIETGSSNPVVNLAPDSAASPITNSIGWFHSSTAPNVPGQNSIVGYNLPNEQGFQFLQLPILSGEKYKITFTLSNYSSGTYEWIIIDENNNYKYGPQVSSNGTFTHEFDLSTGMITTNSFTANSIGFRQTSTTDGNVTVDNISFVRVGDEDESITFGNYSSVQPSELIQDDYHDNTYWKMNGERYGLDPQHAQINGSFFIDHDIGVIYFSSNIANKTIVLDYLSDGLGTESEMRVHKFAEEAMYKHIAHAVLSTRVNTPEYIVGRFKKEKFAETRKAKLRLSNIKLEEITQVLRGKSKQIKH